LRRALACETHCACADVFVGVRVGAYGDAVQVHVVMQRACKRLAVHGQESNTSLGHARTAYASLPPVISFTFAGTSSTSSVAMTASAPVPAAFICTGLACPVNHAGGGCCTCPDASEVVMHAASTHTQIRPRVWPMHHQHPTRVRHAQALQPSRWRAGGPSAHVRGTGIINRIQQDQQPLPPERKLPSIMLRIGSRLWARTINI